MYQETNLSANAIDLYFQFFKAIKTATFLWQFNCVSRLTDKKIDYENSYETNEPDKNLIILETLRQIWSGRLQNRPCSAEVLH